MIAKVEPLLTTRSVSGPFDYRLPESMEDSLPAVDEAFGMADGRGRWRRRIGLPGSVSDQRLPEAATWGGYPGGVPVAKGAPLFPRLPAE